MPNKIVFKKKIPSFQKKILVPGDKSISIRWILISSLSDGISKATNLLMSGDVLASIKAIKKLGVKVYVKNNICKIHGVGIGGYKYKKNLVIDAQNSGTLGRLISGLLIDTPFPIKIIGDNSLSKRDFKRVAKPLSKFGASFNLRNSSNLPLTIIGSKKLKPIKFLKTRVQRNVKAVLFLLV